MFVPFTAMLVLRREFWESKLQATNTNMHTA